MKHLLFIFTILISACSLAQKGEVEITKDPRIEALIKQEASSQQITGYRIQLFFDSNKSSVDEARARFINLFPKVDTYVTYTAPNYFLKVGDFRTQIEAEKVKATVDAQFPTNFIVKERINLPRIDQ